MKTIVKQMLVTAAVLAVCVPAYAAENSGAYRSINKGTKSYQSSARSQKPAQQGMQANTAQPQTADEAAQMAPAAGDAMEPQGKTTRGKTMREEMKLPRKN